MIAGISLEKLGNILLAERPQKRDFVVPTTQLSLVTPDLAPSLAFNVNGVDTLARLTPHALGQIGTWAGIPAAYRDRISTQDNIELLSVNINHWLQKSGKKRLVRMLSSETSSIARAFVSDRFSLSRDNYDLALHIMPRLKEAGMVIKSCQLTDTRLYIQAVDQRLMQRIESRSHNRVIDDALYAGVVISNSEVGVATTSIDPMVYRLVCTNGMIAGTALRRLIAGSSIHRNHVGHSLRGSDNNDSFEVFKDDTRFATDEAFWLQVRDILDAALSEATFRAVVDRMNNATTVELPLDPNRIVEVTAKTLGLNSEEADQVMRNLFTDGDNSLYGLMNAVTRTAQDSPSYDRAVELERLGSDVLTFNREMFSKN